jgi:hypothetical protein
MMLYDYRVEEGIPMPPERYMISKYPWRQMNVGDSFLVEKETAKINSLWDSLSSCRCNAERKTGYKFALRRNSKGIRVWRVK